MTAFITVEGRALAAAMKTICAVATNKDRTIPILRTVRVQVIDQAQLLLTGTDLGMQAEVRVDVIDLGSADFDVCVSAAKLLKIARLAGPAPVRIAPAKQANHVDVDVAEGDATYTLQSFPAADFPTMNGEPGLTPLATFTNGRLASILDRVAYCISTQETRYYLNGVCWEVSELGHFMTATDGHRLASCRHGEKDDAAPLSTIIPYSAVKFLARFSAGKDVAVQARWLPAQQVKSQLSGSILSEGEPFAKRLSFKFGNTQLETKTIDGKFPDWRRVVPKDVKHALVFNADRLRTAIDRVAMIGSERGRAVRVFMGEDGDAFVSVNNPDSGTGVAKTFAAWPKDAADVSSIGFNAHYLRTAIGKAAGDFTLRFSNAGNPSLVDDGDEEMTHVLMPMRI